MLKRPRPVGDDDLLHLTEQQRNEQEELRKRKRRRQFAPMTQYDSMPSTLDQNGITTNTNNRTKISNHPAGYIKKIKLTNFMSHKNFEMEFGPTLNFIVGNNGSGKSAILTAITIGLGAKASETNRGNSFKDLIREGSSTARIVIHLENGSYGSYQPEIYGNEIIIERTLRRDAPAQFFLKSEMGEKISNKKGDIQSIVDYFSIPVSNPMCFLSQDAARSFLTASTPQDKYNHFMKGTLLQEIKSNIESAKLISKTSRENISLHGENVKLLKKEYLLAKQLVKDLNQTSNLMENKRLLQAKSLWIDINTNKSSLNLQKTEISKYRDQIAHTENKITNRQSKIERFRIDNNLLKNELKDKEEKLVKLDENHQLLKDQLRTAKEKYDEKLRNKEEVVSNIDNCEKKISTLNIAIDQLNNQLLKERGGEKEHLKQKMVELEDKNIHLTQELDKFFPQIQDLQMEERRLVGEKNQKLNQLNLRIRKGNQELQNLAAGNNNFLSNFDSNMNRLIALIEKNKSKFTHLPIGPLGNYITVKEEYRKWARPIQRYLSGSLGSFVVSTRNDNRLLRAYIKQCNIRGSITVINYKFENFNIDSGRAQCQYPSLVDTLNFQEPKLLQLFVDLNKIEKVILVENKDMARNFLRTNPRNIQIAISLRDENSGFQLSSGYRIDTVSYERRPKLKIGDNSDDGTRFIKEQLILNTKELDTISNEYNLKANDLKKSIFELKNKTKEINREIEKNTANITSLKIQIDKVVDTGILDSKIREKANQQDAIEGYKTTILQLNEQIGAIKEEVVPIRKNYSESKEQISAAEQVISQMKEDINASEQKVRRYEDDIEKYKDRITQIENAIIQINANIDVLQRGIDDQINEANEYATYDEIKGKDLPNNQDDIRKALNHIANKIEVAERDMGMSQTEVLNLYESRKRDFEDGYEKYKQIEDALSILEESIDKRQQNYHRSRHLTCLEADLDFRASLRIRKFVGHLIFMEEQKSLELSVITPNDKTARNTDTLSGGEKSFSQMALLLATWKPMRSRIIALDEFDVFMDQVNRKIGTDLLVKKLKNEDRTQTIIITPQDIGKIAEIDENVRIHKLKDPQRQNNSNFYNE